MDKIYAAQIKAGLMFNVLGITPGLEAVEENSCLRCEQRDSWAKINNATPGMAPCRKTSTLTFNFLLAGNLPELSQPNQTVYKRLRYSHWECVQMVPQVMRCCRSETFTLLIR